MKKVDTMTDIGSKNVLSYQRIMYRDFSNGNYTILSQEKKGRIEAVCMCVCQ